MKIEIEKIVGNDLSHLNTLDIEELNSFKKLAIEQSVDPTLNEFQKASLVWVANYIESLMVQRSGIYWLCNNFTLPTESSNIVYSKPKDTSEPQCSFKVDDWSELVIKVYTYDVIFEKVGTSSSSEFTYKKLGWSGQKLEIIREFSKGIYKEKSDSINSRMSELNQQLSYMVGLNTQAFEYDRKNKHRVSHVEIRFHTTDEKFVDTELDSKRFIMNDANFHRGYDESFQENVNQERLIDDDESGGGDYTPSWERK